jgi:hypothetical protein
MSGSRGLSTRSPGREPGFWEPSRWSAPACLVIMVKPHAIQVRLVASNNELAQAGGKDTLCGDEDRSDPGSPTLMLPWAAQSFSAVKGILHAPAPSQTLKPETRDAVLLAIAKARAWIDHLIEHRVASFAEIAARECKAERHIRLLAPLAFVSPRIIAALIDGTAPADLTVTGLARTLPYSWTKQERLMGPSAREPRRHARRLIVLPGSARGMRPNEPVSARCRTSLSRSHTDIENCRAET